MRRHSSRYRLGRLALYLLIVVILIYTIFPFYWTVISSLKPSDELFAVRPTYWPTHPTLAHYVQVIQTGDFLKALGNSAIVSVVVTLLSLCIGSLRMLPTSTAPRRCRPSCECCCRSRRPAW